jgi:superfamily II DNA or RNA helicase
MSESTEKVPSEAIWTLEKARGSAPSRSPAGHQQRALFELRRWFEAHAGDPGGAILTLPTGGGKTLTAARFLCEGPLSEGYKVLWLAHTHHLLEQAMKAFDAGTVGQVRPPRERLQLRIVSGTPGHFRPSGVRADDDVVIATLQTVTRAYRESLDQLRAFIDSAKGKLVVVFDEAHHSPAPSYRKLLTALREGGASTLGLTATPTYASEAQRGWLWKLFPQKVVFQVGAAELMAEGVLARPRYLPVKTELVPRFDEATFRAWQGRGRDLPEDVVQALAEHHERNAFIARTYAERRAEFGKTIIFADRWFQCEAIVEALAKHGVKAGAVYSHVDATLGSADERNRRSRDENAQVLSSFRRGELDVLLNIRMLTEGTDIPDAQTVFITRQTTSQILLKQMIGRALRGPKFGGTPEANIVLFMDDWRQAIQFAEYSEFDGGLADAKPARQVRTPMQLISIQLVKQLLRSMGGTSEAPPANFLSLLPVGSYETVFDLRVEESDDIESHRELVPVMIDEREGFEAMIDALCKEAPAELEETDATLEALRPILERLCDRHLAKVARPRADLLPAVFAVARHVAQSGEHPRFFDLDERSAHDLDAIARRFIANGLDPRAVRERLRTEYAREDRYWRSLYPSFELFRQQYESRQAIELDKSDGGAAPPPPEPATSVPPPREVSEEVKWQIREREQDRAPPLLPRDGELARKTAGRPRNGRPAHWFHQNLGWLARQSQARPQRIPHRHLRNRRRAPRRHSRARAVPWRLELHHSPRKSNGQ